MTVLLKTNVVMSRTNVFFLRCFSLSRIALLFVLIQLNVVSSAKPIANVDSVLIAVENLNSDRELNSFVSTIESIDDVLGMATKFGIERYTAIVDQAIRYCEETKNDIQKRRCLLYRHLVPTQYTKLEQMKALRKLSLYEDIQASNHYMKLLQALRYIYGDLELFDQFLPMIDEIRKFNKGEYSKADIEYMRLTDRSSMYYRTKNYRKALQVFGQIGRFITEKISLKESSRLNNMGLCYQNMRMPDSALLFFNKSIDTYTSVLTQANQNGLPADSFFYYVVKSNIADIDVEQGNFKHAESTFLGQLRYSNAYYSPHLVLSSFLSIAKLEYHRNNLSKSLAYIDSIKHNYSKSAFVNYYIEGLKLKSRIYLVQGNRELAAKSEATSSFLLDSIRAAKAELNYQAAAIKLEIRETQQALSEANEDLDQAKMQSRLLTFGLLFALLFIGLGLWGLNVFRKKNKLLSNQKDSIDAAFQEREVLLREIHHRVKNNLNIVSSLVQLQSRRIKDEEVKSIFKESQNYILSMSKVHQHLYEQEDLKKIEMGAYFNSLLVELINGNAGNGVNHTVQSNGVSLTLDNALVLGILTSELVTNSMKYAFLENKGEIYLEIKLDNNTCYYTYRDSGKGFNKDKINAKNSFGQKLIKMSTEQLRGQLKLETEGTFSVSISFEIKS